MFSVKVTWYGYSPRSLLRPPPCVGCSHLEPLLLSSPASPSARVNLRAARVINLFFTMRLFPFTRALRLGQSPTSFYHCRLYHSATARVTTVNPNGSLFTRDTEVKIGDSGEAYVYVTPEICDAIRSAVSNSEHAESSASVVSVVSGPSELPTNRLEFHHQRRHFTHSTAVPFLTIFCLIYPIWQYFIITY